ncbi:hypothetical protein D7D26_09585, partial [Pyramidobacter sp. CG50-2]
MRVTRQITGLTGTKVTYGIDKTKLVQNIIGSVINQINNGSTPITNVQAKFKIADAGTGTKTITADKTGTETIKFEGDGTYITSAMTANDVKYSLDTAALNNAIGGAANWTVKDNESPTPGSKQINAATPLVVKGENGVTTKVDTGGLTIGLNGANLSSTINNSSTVINNVEAKFKIADTGTGTKTITADKTGTEIITFAGDGNIIESEVDTSGVKYKVNTANLNTAIDNQIANNPTVTGHTTDINALKGGFTVSNAAGTKQTITLGGATKKNIQFVGEANKILVEVASAADGATVTVKTDPNLGTHLNIANNGAITSLNTTVNGHTTDITALKAGFNVKSGSSVGPIVAGDTLEFAGVNYVQTAYDAAAKKLTVGLDTTALNSQINNQVNSNTTVVQHGTDITALKAGFDLKAGSTTNNVQLGGTPVPTVEFATTDDTMTVGLTGTKVTYGIDTAKLAQNITGSVITNINNATTTPITNISAKFGVTAETGTKKTVTLAKDTEPTVKFEGDGTYIKSAMTTDGVKYSLDTAALTGAIGGTANWTIKDAEAVPGSKLINSATPLVVTGAGGVTTKVDAGGLTIGLDGSTLSNTINNSFTVINNVEAKFKIADAGTGTKTITADKTGTEIITFAGDGNIIESEVGTSGVKYKVNAANLNTAINNQIANNTTVQNLAGGFTVSNEAGTKQDITLGGATKKNIKFAGEANMIDVTVTADGSDGAKVTVSANPNLGQNIDISNNSAITTITGTLSGGLNFAGNDGAVNRTLGQTLNLKGGLASVTSGASGKNLGVKKNAAGDGFDLVMSEPPEFASVTVKSGTNEIKLNGATGTIAGLSNTTLDTGWGTGIRAGQAATEGQLKAATLAAGQNATYTIGADPHGSAPGILLD